MSERGENAVVAGVSHHNVDMRQQFHVEDEASDANVVRKRSERLRVGRGGGNGQVFVGRGVLVELTRKGRAAVDTIWGQYAEGAEAFFADYTISELKTILRYLLAGRMTQEESIARVKALPPFHES